MSFSEDLKNLDPNNPGMWPKAIQIIIFVVLFMALLFAGWKFDISKQRIKLANLEKKEVQTINTLKNKQRKAANLNALKEQMKEMEKELREFREYNRNISSSPSLQMRVQEMGREIDLQNSLYVTLKTQHEKAKIDEVERDDMVQIIDGPSIPAKLTKPRRGISITLSFFFGIFVGIFIVYFRDRHIEKIGIN